MSSAGTLGEGGASWGLQKAVLSSHRIGGPCLPNWQVKLSIKEKLARPGQGGGGRNLALVGNIVGREREIERLSQGAG